MNAGIKDKIVSVKFCVIDTGNTMAPIPMKWSPQIASPIASEDKNNQIRLLIKLFAFIRVLHANAVNDPKSPISSDNATINEEYV